jgi:signal transduction histidine kinase
VELRQATGVAVPARGPWRSGDVIYGDVGLGLLAYALGFAASALGASNSRQSVKRAEQAELLLAQSQRSHEEQLRATRLAESTRIAREIHDVLAHALAGLTIQLEATTALIEQGAERDAVLARVRRAHELAREGKHAPGAAVSVAVHAGGRPDDEVSW